MKRLWVWLSRTKVSYSVAAGIIFCSSLLIPLAPPAVAQFNTFLSYGSAGAAPIVVTGIGAAKNAGAIGAGITVIIPSATVPSGALIVCPYSGLNVANTPTATDPSSNIYHPILLQQFTSASQFSGFLYAYNVTGFTGSVVISGIATNAGGQGGATCIYATGVQTTSDPHDATVDKTAHQVGTSATSYSIASTAAPTMANSLMVSYVSIYSNATVSMSGSGSPWIAFPALSWNAGAVSNIVAGYQVTSLSQTYTGTESGSATTQYNAGITAFKP